MRLKYSTYITLFMFALVLVGCGGSGGDDDSPNPPTTGGNDDEPMIPDPAAATLVFPEDNTECNTGIINPNNTALSTVTFEWNASQNTDSYTVTVTNLNTNNSSFTNSTTNEADITLERGTPYSWFVTSRATGTTSTAISDTFQFYNEGPGIENYAPFPAEVVQPTQGENFPSGTTTVNLEWSGADIDNDITEYEIFFGTDPEPTNSLGVQSGTVLADLSVTTSTTYYWRVLTRDNFGNTSQSQIFTFRVN